VACEAGGRVRKIACIFESPSQLPINSSVSKHQEIAVYRIWRARYILHVYGGAVLGGFRGRSASYSTAPH
jgi:hypothetical protein